MEITQRPACDSLMSDTGKPPEYADISKKVSFLMLPPYSLDLNPIEQVWRITRIENTHNTFFTSTSNLANTVDSAFDAWAAPNDQLKSLYSFK